MRGITGSSLQGRIIYTKKPKKKICKNCDSEFWAKAKYTEGYQDYCGFCRMVYRQDKRRITKKRKVKGPTLYNPKSFSKRTHK
ncbi:hypothetical protein BW152_11980 [Lactococcus lactis]|uniref:hypothetical protein n=1 Tax=Lactococcus lactis TaxID=1358 RepID=UPI00071E4FDA|nr:hypothetical protein [Lactococcus lactis]PFG79162.1 hypothetical protein BW152_11980 [Lactococcus lactis]